MEIQGHKSESVIGWIMRSEQERLRPVMEIVPEGEPEFIDPVTGLEHFGSLQLFVQDGVCGSFWCCQS